MAFDLLRRHYRTSPVMASPTGQRQALSLVTGANGHLGNNIVRELCARGQAVRAGVRDTRKTAPFEGLDGVSIVRIDIQDARSMLDAMAGVDTVYASAAVLKLWAKDPKKEVYHVNMSATRILMHAARASGVRRVVFVSSIAALDCARTPTSETSGFIRDRRHEYYNSKADSDRLALHLGRELGLDVVSVLPGTLVGGHCFALTDSYRTLASIYHGRAPIDPNCTLNWCDVRDVARGCVEAATHGRAGQRYLLAQEHGSGFADTRRVLAELYPKRPDFQRPPPPRPPRWLMWLMAWLVEKIAVLKMHALADSPPPQIQASLVDMLWGRPSDFDTSKARIELGFRIKSVADTIFDAVEYLDANPRLMAEALGGRR